MRGAEAAALPASLFPLNAVPEGPPPDSGRAHEPKTAGGSNHCSLFKINKPSYLQQNMKANFYPTGLQDRNHIQNTFVYKKKTSADQQNKSRNFNIHCFFEK